MTYPNGHSDLKPINVAYAENRVRVLGKTFSYEATIYRLDVDLSLIILWSLTTIDGLLNVHLYGIGSPLMLWPSSRQITFLL